MMSNKEIRRKAMERLNYYWVESVFLYIILFCGVCIAELVQMIYIPIKYPELRQMENPDIFSLLQFMSENRSIFIILLCSAFVCFLLITPMYYGIKWCFFQAAQWKPAPVSGAFYAYYSPSKWLKTLAINAKLFVNKFVYAVPSMAICFAAYIISEILKDGAGELARFFVNIGLAVVFAGSVMIYMSLTVKFDLVVYVYADQPDSSISAIFSRGVAAAEKSRWRYGGLKIWFLPLLLVSTAGFPSIVIIPMYWMVKSIGAVQIIKGGFADKEQFIRDVMPKEAKESAMSIEN